MTYKKDFDDIVKSGFVETSNSNARKSPSAILSRLSGLMILTLFYLPASPPKVSKGKATDQILF